MNWYINRTADIMNGDRAASRTASIMPLAYPGDGNAHIWRVTVTDNGAPASLTGAVPIGYFMRGYDGETVMQTGTISGNVISVTIPAEAYAYSGHVTAIIRINHGGANMTIDAVAYEIGPNVTGDIIDPGEVIPGIDDLIAEIERMETATEAAEAALAQMDDRLAEFDVAVETFFPHRGGVGALVTVEGTVDASPAGLTIYGKSVQNGTPSPSAPVDIVTAGSSGTLAMVSVAAGTDIHNSATDTAQFIDENGNITNNADYLLTDYIPLSGNYLYIRWENVVGTACYLRRAYYDSNKSFIRRDIHQLTRGQSGTFWTPLATARYVRICVENSSTNRIYGLKVHDGYGVAIDTTPNGLPGIPVASGGNYTDTNGQMWICDTIDLEAGVYTKRVETYTVTGSESISKSSESAVDTYLLYFPTGTPDLVKGNTAFLCSHFRASGATAVGNAEIPTTGNYLRMRCHYAGAGASTVEAFTAAITGMTVVYALAAPVVTQLTEAQIAALRALRGRKGLTNLYSADPAGPEFRAEMYIDIPTYIQWLLHQMDRGFNVAAVNNGLESTSIE